MLSIDQKNDYLLFWHGGSFESFHKKNVELYLTGRHQKRFWDEYYIPYHIEQKKPMIHHIPQNGLSMPKKNSPEYIVTIHDLIPYILPETVGPSYAAKFQNEIPYIVKECSHILTVSEWSKKDLLYLFDIPEDKVTVTPLAAHECFKPLPLKATKEYLQRKYKISEDFILYLGGFSKRKNVSGLLYAFSKLQSILNRSLKLVLLGQGKDDWRGLKELAYRLKISEHVIFTGFIDEADLPCFYNASIAFVYPSLYEGFGLPVLEAMSCGTPTITSNCTSIPEVTGEAAILIDPHDTDALTASMLEVIECPDIRENLKTKGLLRASTFNWMKTAEKTLEVYELFQ